MACNAYRLRKEVEIERSLNPGRRMRESELLFQVILTQVACTRQSVGEEGVKVLPPVALASNMRRRAGGRHGSRVCVSERERGITSPAR